MNLGKDPRFDVIQRLSLPLCLIRGVGPQRASALDVRGLRTILDLFYFIPIRYEDRSTIIPIASTKDGSLSLVKGTVIEGKEEVFYPSRKRIYRITISDDDGQGLELIWFHYIKPHLAGFSRPGLKITAYGSVKILRGKRQIFHPDVALSEYGSKDSQGFIPVYSQIKGLSGNTLRRLLNISMDQYLNDLIDPVPAHILEQLKLPDLRSSIHGVHFPPLDQSFELLDRAETPFHRRLVFDRFFYIMLALAFRKQIKDNISKSSYMIPGDIEDFLGFTLTDDQRKAISEIAGDLGSGHPMNRLLMGDVGTGKTAIAAIAAHMTVFNNHQVALMAPTQILAGQHMIYFSGLPEKMGFRPVLVTSDLKKNERENIYRKIQDKEYNLIIGTHSLISSGLIFADLGLAIIDEQHRFGVRQRAMIDSKGDNPHILVMTATPIPRTLAIAIYGDMDISTIKEYPGGHRPVKTCLVGRTRKQWAFERLKECIAKGRQAFVICPVIEETEDSDLKGAKEVYNRFKKTFSPAYRIGLVHGRMPFDERETIIQAFYRGECDILVATTVVEVGVHVPNATIMIIEHPERFGLAQLHQLRGRVGRGTEEGMCMMIIPDSVPEKTEARLKVLAQSSDGFEIAQKDLEFRGHGELTGLRQAGLGEIDPSDIVRYQDLLLAAKNLSQELVRSDKDLSGHDHRYLRVMMESMSGVNLDL